MKVDKALKVAVDPQISSDLKARAAEDLAEEVHRLREKQEVWKSAALQAKHDLQAIEKGFKDAKEWAECPIGPGCTFASWTSPANTMRWIDKLEKESENDE